MAFNNTAAGWMPTSDSNFNFSNCSIAAAWGAIASTSFDFPMNETEQMLRNGLEGFWRSNNISPPSQIELLSWFVNATLSASGSHDELLSILRTYTMNDCRVDFCKKLPWQGNSDLTGRGMIFSYCFQAALVTLYLVALLLSNFNLVRSDQNRRALIYRFIIAFRESARSFLNATFVFSGAVLVATIYTIAKAVYESNASPNKPMGMSGPVVNMFVALFSIFPPIVLHALTSRFLRCLTTRKLIWVFHGTLIVVSVTLYHAYRYNPLEDEDNWRYWDLRGDIDNQYQWELYCLDRPNMVRTNRMIIGLGSFLVAIGLFYILFVWNLFRISIFDAERHKIFRQLHNVWWLIAAGVGFVGMWLCLILFLDLRQELYQNSGATNKDSEWTFGQVLATSTWVPVIADFLHILYLGPERALDRLVSVGYTVVDTRSLDTNEPSEKAGRISGCHTALDTAKNGHTP